MNPVRYATPSLAAINRVNVFKIATESFIRGLFLCVPAALPQPVQTKPSCASRTGGIIPVPRRGTGTESKGCESVVFRSPSSASTLFFLGKISSLGATATAIRAKLLILTRCTFSVCPVGSKVSLPCGHLQCSEPPNTSLNGFNRPGTEPPPPGETESSGRWGAPTEKLQPSAREEWDRKTACPSKGITEEKRVLATAGLSQRAHVCPEL